MAARPPLSAAAAARPRPLSPHIGVYRWGAHMLVSILHRATGVALALAGLPLFAWWLAALAGGPADYARFADWFTTDTGGLNILGWVLAVGLSFAFFQHLASGVRHFFMDAGALFELRRNRASAQATLLAAAGFTALFWLALSGVMR